MRKSHLSTALAVTAAAVGTMIAGAPIASAKVACDPGEFFRVTSHSGTFTQVGAAQAVNKSPSTVTLHVTVGTSHTSTRSFTGTLTTSVEGSFWVFAKASATASASVTLQTSSTMTSTFGADVVVSPHTTRTVQFGFRRYSQTIQQYHLYNNSISSCAVAVDHTSTVVAPYATTFIVS